MNACILVINVFKNGASEQLRTAYLSSSVGHRLVTVWEGFFFWYCDTLSSLCVHTLLVGDLSLMLHGLSETISLAELGHRTHIFQIIFEISPLQTILLTVCV